MSEYFRAPESIWDVYDGEFEESHHIHAGTQIEGGTWSIEEISLSQKNFQEIEVSESKDAIYESLEDYMEEDNEWITLGKWYEVVKEGALEIESDLWMREQQREDFEVESVLEYFEFFGKDYDETSFSIRDMAAAESVTATVAGYFQNDTEYLERFRDRDEKTPIQEFLGALDEDERPVVMPKGDCCIKGLVSAWLMEKMYKEDFTQGTGIINQSYHSEKLGHAWAEMVNEEGERIIMDPSMKYVGEPEVEPTPYERFETVIDMENEERDFNRWNYHPELEIRPEILENS